MRTSVDVKFMKLEVTIFQRNSAIARTTDTNCCHRTVFNIITVKKSFWATISKQLNLKFWNVSNTLKIGGSVCYNTIIVTRLLRRRIISAGLKRSLLLSTASIPCMLAFLVMNQNTHCTRSESHSSSISPQMADTANLNVKPLWYHVVWHSLLQISFLIVPGSKASQNNPSVHCPFGRKPSGRDV